MKQYLDLLDTILRTGDGRSDRTGTGTISVFGRQLRFPKLDKSFPLVTTKKTSLKTIFHELKWMLNGWTNIDYLVMNGVGIWTDWPLKNYNTSMLRDNFDGADRQMEKKEFEERIRSDPQFATQWGDCGPVYGYQWRNWPDKTRIHDDNPEGRPYFTAGPFGKKFAYEKSIDQMKILLDTLRNNPTSRRMIVSAWNVADLEDMAVAGLPPCHLLMQFYTRKMSIMERYNYQNANMEIKTVGGYIHLNPLWEGKVHESKLSEADKELANKMIERWNKDTPKYHLDCQVYIRSNDCFLGMPFNIAQYAMLTHLVAHSVGMVPGDLVYTTGDTHIYSNHIDQVLTQLQRTPYTPPVLRIHGPPKAPWDYEWEDIQLLDYQAHPHIAGEVAI